MTEAVRGRTRLVVPVLDFRPAAILAVLAVLLGLKFALADDLSRWLNPRPAHAGRTHWVELAASHEPPRLHGFKAPPKPEDIQAALGLGTPPDSWGEPTLDRPVRLALDERGHVRIMPLSGPAALAVSGRMDLNAATARDLAMLDGVGPRTAEAIVREREAGGRFRSLDDLARVKGIGPIRLEQLKKTERLSAE